ncbi:MAG: substrate-binding domain-containing protein [Treponema sp.]|nr:substrate-binding domain-containing protein [Treponema sp.]
MEKNREERKLGFILSTIHAGSALKLWQKLALKAQQDGGAFFIFPGGKLGEPLRNDIYKLVNSSNVDGLISWASSISGSVSVSELEDFHKNFGNIPFVTIGQKVYGHPSVEFDAYTGMKELVRHFILSHGVRKLAFLRAPENHTSAEERFRGFKDALKEAGIDIELPENQRLISDPVSWYDGRKALAQLCEERGLVPGKDFEAVLTASDLMSFAALDYLKDRGVRIPKDLLIGGFNDTAESRISVPAFSTVHMPHAELGIAAYEKISDILGGKLGVSDSVLHAYPVIRESCGCTHTKIWNSSDSRTKIRSKEQFISETAKILRIDPQATGVDVMFNALFSGDKNKFYELFKQKIAAYFHNDGDTLFLFTVLALFRNVTCLDPDYIEKIVRHVTVRIPRILERVLIEKQYQGEKINTEISALKNDLLSIFDRKKLISVLKEHLVKIGINTAAVVLYEDENYSNYIGGFSSASDDSDSQLNEQEARFPSDFLVPERFSSDFSKGVFIVQPLFVDERPYGYIICNYSGCSGMVYEDLRSSVSAALQSIFLFEQTNEAKRIAEQAEFAKTEFFANVGSDLCDPLKNISAKLQQMEENVEKGVLEQDILTEQLLFLRSQVNSQLEKTETLIDLTRSQVDDLPMDKKLFDIRQVLPGGVTAGLAQNFPLLYGDSERLKRALQTIFDFSEKNPCVSEKIDGIHIEFYSNHFDWKKTELLLAEKIILLQFGILEKSENYAEVTLPWPNLAGLPPDTHASSVSNSQPVFLYSVSDNSKNAQDCAERFNIPVKNVFEDSQLPSKSDSVLFWEPDNAPIDEWVKLYGLRKNETLFRMPVIAYSHNMIGQNFIDFLEQKIKTQRTAPVIFVNASRTYYASWATEANSVSVSSVLSPEFNEILSEITPALIVFEKIDEESLHKIRQTKKTTHVPVLVLLEHVLSDEEVEALCAYPRTILCNKGAAESEPFEKRIKEIIAGDEILPPHTGAIVKKAILYLNKNASRQIVRWKLADTVHVSEDYLTRIFHKEIGLSLWEYLNLYRINLATKMLMESNDTIYEIAEKSGFQDQAYFCRVFKKIYGVPPGKIRNK